MRLLMTTDCVGGVWTYALDLVRALRRHDVDVVIANMGGPLGDDQREQALAAGAAAVRDSTFRLEWMDDPWADVERAGEWLLELAEDEAPDVVHLNSYAHGALPWRRPALVVGHSCVFSWWQAVHGEAPPARWQRYHDALRSGLESADAVVAPTRAMLRELQLHYDLRSGAAIANGSSTPVADDTEKQPFVLAAGRFWDEAKNLTALDEAAAGLAWPVVVAGSGAPPRNAIGLGPLPQAELAALRASAAVFAAPARYEPFGLAALEAGRAGCALVLGDIDSLREVWGDAALYVDPARPRELRRAIERLIDEPALRAALARRAAARSRRYTAERMASDYARLYARLLEPRAVPA